VLLLEIVAVVLLADFVSGLVHWWEDAYARVGDGPLGRVARDNLRHHARPREFLANGYWASSWDLWLLGAAAVAACAWLGALSWHVLLFAVLVANANQIHKWAHMQAKELPLPVAWLQRTQVLQTTRHHSRHPPALTPCPWRMMTPSSSAPRMSALQWWQRQPRPCASPMCASAPSLQRARLPMAGR
jgi:ubiquitin-conjugating enzyme E2 variant